MQDAPAIAWRWSAALPGALFAIPAAIVTLRDPSIGLALAYGAVPAAAVGITPTRRSRHVIVVVGALAVPMIGAGLSFSDVGRRQRL